MKNERIYWLDLCRCLAILCVVLCHVIEGIYSMEGADSFTLESVSVLSLRGRLFAFTVFTIGRCGVPFFLFLTGYLLLGRHYDQAGCVRFWKRNLLSLLFAAEIWIIVYDLFLAWFYKIPFSLRELVYNMLFLKNVNMTHVWYLPMILGVYVFLPLISNMLEYTGRKCLIFILAIAFVWQFLPSVFEIWYWASERTVLSSPALNFLGGGYGLYLIVGYFAGKGAFDFVRTGWLILTAGVMFPAAVALQLYAYSLGYAYNIWYNCAFLFLLCTALFLMFSRLPEIRTFRLIGNTARYAFGIYLVHNPILMYLQEHCLTDAARPVRVLFLFTASLLLSWLLVAFLCRIPRVGRVLFVYK